MFRFGLRSVRPVFAATAAGVRCFTPGGNPQIPGSTGPTIDPALDIYELKENAAEGKHIRLAYRPGLRTVAVTNYPQLGPMKKDPNDPVPQFDYEKRTTCRLRPYEIASMLCVMESKQTQAALSTKFWDLKFGPHDGGFALTGSIARTGSDEREDWQMVFAKTNVTQLYRFLDRSLHETYQFPKKKIYIYQQASTVPQGNFQQQGNNRNQGGNFQQGTGINRQRQPKKEWIPKEEFDAMKKKEREAKEKKADE